MRVQKWLHLPLTTMEISHSWRWVARIYTWKGTKWLKNTWTLESVLSHNTIVQNLKLKQWLYKRKEESKYIHKSGLKIQKTTFSFWVHTRLIMDSGLTKCQFSFILNFCCQVDTFGALVIKTCSPRYFFHFRPFIYKKME